jgi:hypothetical protein
MCLPITGALVRFSSRIVARTRSAQRALIARR